MNRTSPGGSRASKSGVAIVLVLGILSLLMVLAVSFAITMRVERAGAGNYARNVYAKHLTWAALGRAMEAIDQHMASSTDPYASSSNSVVYPEWEFLVSGPTGPRIIGGMTSAWEGIIVPTKEQLKYIPDVLTGVVAANWKTLS